MTGVMFISRYVKIVLYAVCGISNVVFSIRYLTAFINGQVITVLFRNKRNVCIPMTMEQNKSENNFVPKITDIEWKVEVLTNTAGVGSDNLLYTVVLKTDGEDVQFTCGTQQLQDLVYKLKDLTRHCDKVKNELS